MNGGGMVNFGGKLKKSVGTEWQSETPAIRFQQILKK